MNASEENGADVPSNRDADEELTGDELADETLPLPPISDEGDEGEPGDELPNPIDVEPAGTPGTPYGADAGGMDSYFDAPPPPPVAGTESAGDPVGSEDETLASVNETPVPDDEEGEGEPQPGAEDAPAEEPGAGPENVPAEPEPAEPEPEEAAFAEPEPAEEAVESDDLDDARVPETMTDTTGDEVSPAEDVATPPVTEALPSENDDAGTADATQVLEEGALAAAHGAAPDTDADVDDVDPRDAGEPEADGSVVETEPSEDAPPAPAEDDGVSIAPEDESGESDTTTALEPSDETVTADDATQLLAAGALTGLGAPVPAVDDAEPSDDVAERAAEDTAVPVEAVEDTTASESPPERGEVDGVPPLPADETADAPETTVSDAAIPGDVDAGPSPSADDTEILAADVSRRDIRRERAEADFGDDEAAGTAGGVVMAKNRRGRAAAIWTTAVVAVLVLGYVGAAWYFQDKVPNNTSVDGINVGGLSAPAAIDRIESEFAEREPVPLSVTMADNSLEMDPEALGLDVDAAASIEPLTGFSLNPVSMWTHLTGAGDIDPIAVIDEDAAHAELENARSSLEVEPVEGAIALADGAADVTEASDGIRVDVPASVEIIREQWLTADGAVELAYTLEEPEVTQAAVDEAMETIVTPLLSGPVTVTVDDISQDLSPAELTAASMFTAEDGALKLTMDGGILTNTLVEHNDGFKSDGKDAQIVIQNGAPAIIPSEVGRGLNPDDLAEGVYEAALSTDDRLAEMEMTEADAEFTTADAEELGVKEVVGEFSTPLTADNVRTQNLINGTSIINNYLLKPGDTFSLIQALGPVTAERGFVSSGVVENGFATTAMGGGLSQLSTTTYNAAYFAGMDLVEHKPHSRWFSRYPEGREATMWEPSVDMKFKNSTPYGALVQAWVAGGSVHVRIWSTEYYDVTYGSSGRYNVTSPTTKYNTSPNCVPESGGQPGFSINGWRERHIDGALDHRDEWSWTYQPWHNVVCGPQPSASSNSESDSDSDDD